MLTQNIKTPLLMGSDTLGASSTANSKVKLEAAAIKNPFIKMAKSSTSKPCLIGRSKKARWNIMSDTRLMNMLINVKFLNNQRRPYSTIEAKIHPGIQTIHWKKPKTLPYFIV